MPGFTGPYRVVKTFGLAGPLATELTVELVHKVSDDPNLQPNVTDSVSMYTWHSKGFVPNTGASTEINLLQWEKLQFCPAGPTRYEPRIRQVFFNFGNFDGIKVYALVAPFKEVAEAFAKEAHKMVADAPTKIQMFNLSLRPDPILTHDPLWAAVSKSITLTTPAGPRVEVFSQGLEMHIQGNDADREGDNADPEMLGKCVRHVLGRLSPYVTVNGLAVA